MIRWKMKKLVRTGIAFGLAAMMCVMNPMHTLAASEEEEEEGGYISEVRISTANTAADAKDWLWDNGYEVQDQNLNEGTGKDAVYLGYKTTNDPDKAITDMAVMYMDGGYSCSEYEAMLKNQKKNVEKLVGCIQNALKEYRINYNDGAIGAKKAHEMMNQLKEDDSGKGMGDFLLDESLSEKNLVKVIMQGNSTAMISIYQGLALACSESKNDNWLKRLSEAGPGSAASDEYDERAREIYENQWDTLRDSLKSYQESGLKVGASEEKIKTWREENRGDSYTTWLQNGMVYELLASYRYGEGTLADFFLKDKTEFKMQDLYPVVKAMTAGQIEIANLIGLSYVVQVAGVSKETWDKAEEKTENAVEDAVEETGEKVNISKTISVYAGVDRSLFEGGVALTNDAMRKSNSTGNVSYLYGNLSKGTEIALYAVAGAFATLGLSLILFHAVAMSITKSAIVSGAITAFETLHPIVNGWNTFCHALFGEVAAKGGYILGAIALGVALIVACVYVALEVYNYYHPEYSEIPRILVDEKKDANGKTTYMNYYAAKDRDGNPADLNAWKGRLWNALYTTKDRDAGDPITTDMFCQEGDNSQEEGYSAVHLFGEEGAYNLNKYCFKDNVDGIYMFFVRENREEEFTGSAFGTSNMVLSAGLGALGGILLGTFLTTLAMKRKRKKKQTEV